MLKTGQDDEATPDPDGVPWEPERAGDQDGADSSPDEACEPEGGQDAECGDEAAEWDIVPEELPGDDEQGKLDHRGDGDGQEATPGASATGEISREELSVEQADSLLRHCGRLQALQQAEDIFAGLGGAMGASLQNTVAQVMGN